MVESYLRQSPLAPLGLQARASTGKAGVRMGERPFRGMIGLRGNAGDPDFGAAATKALGFALPTEPNTAAGRGAKRALWMGPDEWLIVTAPGAGPKTIAGLRKNLAVLHAAVFDVSDSRTIIELSGRHAREVLMKGCSIDFHPRVFGPGQCVQSTMALAHVLIHQTALNKRTTTPTYHIYIHRSFAEYLWAWLEDAGGEYGIGVRAGYTKDH